jgi:hypothetical protein
MGATPAVIAIILILIIVGAILLFFLFRGYSLNNSPNVQQYLAQFASPIRWGPESPTGTAPRNSCQQYTFPGVNTPGFAVPGTPSLDPSILNRLPPQAPGPCNDVDQIVAQQVTHTCMNSTGVTGAFNICFRYDGTTARPGETETYYSQLSCPTKQCAGALSLIGLNYFPQQHRYSCVTKSGTSLLVGPTCNIADMNELFRVTRINPGDKPSTLVAGQGQNGPLMQLYDRQSNQCFIPSSSVVSGQVGGTGPVVSANTVTLGPCTGVPGNGQPGMGYHWLAIPALVGSTGMTGPTGSSSISFATPQQIAYIGNVDISTIPLTSQSDVLNWLITNQVKTMGSINGLLALAPYGLGLQSPQTAQIITYPIFNIITSLPACAPGVTPCVPI